MDGIETNNTIYITDTQNDHHTPQHMGLFEKLRTPKFSPTDWSCPFSRKPMWVIVKYPNQESVMAIENPLDSILEIPINAFRISYMEVSWNGGTPKPSILVRFSLINHPFWGTPILDTQVMVRSVSILLRLVQVIHDLFKRDPCWSLENHHFE